MVDWLALKSVTTYVPEDATRTWKILTTRAGLTTGKSFEEITTDYQVAAGKTFTIVLIQVHPSATGRVCTIFQSDAADGTDGEVDKFVTTTTAGGGAYDIPIVDEPTIAAEKFLNWKVSNATTPPDLIIIGFEA